MTVERRDSVADANPEAARDPRYIQTLKIVEGIIPEGFGRFGLDQWVSLMQSAQDRVAYELGSRTMATAVDRDEVTNAQQCCVTSDFSDARRATIIMRHGVAELAEELAGLSVTEQNIKRLEEGPNFRAKLTARSMAQAVSTAIGIAWIAEKNEQKIEIFSSANARAIQVAGIMGAITNTPVQTDRRLNCVNYPRRPIDETIDILGPVNQGSLPWDRVTVNRLLGHITYEKMIGDMNELLGKGISVQRSLRVLMTHTLQTQAVDTIMKDEPVRLKELGFRVASPNFRQVFPNGFYMAA